MGVLALTGKQTVLLVLLLEEEVMFRNQAGAELAANATGSFPGPRQPAPHYLQDAAALWE